MKLEKKPFPSVIWQSFNNFNLFLYFFFFCCLVLLCKRNPRPLCECHASDFILGGTPLWSGWYRYQKLFYLYISSELRECKKKNFFWNLPLVISSYSLLFFFCSFSKWMRKDVCFQLSKSSIFLECFHHL